MTVIRSEVSTTSDAFKANAERMRALVEDLRDKAAAIERGGSDDAADSGDENETQSVYADLELKATDRLRFFADYEHNLEDNIRLRTAAGIFYQSQCWAVFFRLVDEPGNTKAEVTLTLNGIGDFGF